MAAESKFAQYIVTDQDKFSQIYPEVRSQYVALGRELCGRQNSHV